MPKPEDVALLLGYFEGLEDRRREIETKWGVGRVELLASDDLRAKWRRQCVTWGEAYLAAWEAPYLTGNLINALAEKTAAMRRGYDALDAHAETQGHRPIQAWVWEVMLADGSVAAIVQTNAEAGKVIAEGRYLVVYTLAEIGNVISALPESLQMAKQVFPGSRFAPPRAPDPLASVGDVLGAGPWRPEGDEIPFGRELAADPSTSGDDEWA